MPVQEEPSRDLASLVVPQLGSLLATGDPWEPWRLVDTKGVAVDSVAVFFRELLAAGRSAAAPIIAPTHTASARPCSTRGSIAGSNRV